MKADHPAIGAHTHVFSVENPVAERGTRLVMWITIVMMVIEIGSGWWLNSMALLADGWHMSSHALAIGVSALAYAAARRLSKDHRFAFGTWKIEILGGFASAIFLLGVAVMMFASSVERIIFPQSIQYREAIVIAVLGLMVNLVCAWILGKAHHHGHSHHHDHEHAHGHHDLNLKSAYLHVIADATTSVLAIVALVGGWICGWSWLDPLTGILGSVLVAIWAKGLIEETSAVLLDREMDHPVVAEIREAIESSSTGGVATVVDLHVWRVGQGAYSCAITVVTPNPTLTPAQIRERLAIHEEIAHSTIEIHYQPNLTELDADR